MKKSTNLSAPYGELGRTPLAVICKINMIKYWMKILQQSDSSLVKKIYKMLQEDADRNFNYSGKNWAAQIKGILQQHGLEYVWQLQSEIEIPSETIKLRIFDTYKQNWYSAINNSPRLQSYSIFKHQFELEKYFVIHEKKYQISLSRFRTSSHDLKIESGRYNSIPR